MAYFKSENHEKVFNEAIEIAGISEMDYTNRAVLYLLTSVDRVAENINRIYELKGQYINPDGINSLCLSRGEQFIVASAFNLYNGYQMEGINISPYSVLSYVDEEYIKVYLNGLQLKTGSLVN